MIKVNRVGSTVDDVSIYDIEHFEKRRFGWNVLGFVDFDFTLGAWVGLTPDFKCEVHLRKRFRGKLFVGSYAEFDTFKFEHFFM